MNNSKNTIPVYMLNGKVVHGRGIGKNAGMPTANLEITSEMIMPPLGVYVSKIYIDSEEYIGVTNVGRRPTVDNDKDISIETYIIDFGRDIYGEEIVLKLYTLIRTQQKFESMPLLLEQLRLDCIEAKKYFS